MAEAAEAKGAALDADTDALVYRHLQRMKQAYCAVFVAGNATPGDVKAVMQDLMFYAKADVHFFNDTRLQDVYAGRKQVMQRIFEHTNMSVDHLMKYHLETK